MNNSKKWHALCILRIESSTPNGPPRALRQLGRHQQHERPDSSEDDLGHTQVKSLVVTWIEGYCWSAFHLGAEVGLLGDTLQDPLGPVHSAGNGIETGGRPPPRITAFHRLKRAVVHPPVTTRFEALPVPLPAFLTFGSPSASPPCQLPGLKAHPGIRNSPN